MNSIRMRKIIVTGMVLPVTVALITAVFFLIVPASGAAGSGSSVERVLDCPTLPPQTGATLIVNTTVMTTCDGICGSDHCTLGEAIHLANTLAGENTIELEAGAVYTLTAADNGTNGYPLITSTMTIYGNGAKIIRSPSAPEFRLLNISDSGSLTLTQVTIENGLLTSPTPQGAGIYNAGNLAIYRSTLLHNHCDSNITYGGAIYNLGATKIDSSTFYSNSVTSFASFGGAIYNNGPLEIINSTFVDNLAGGDDFDQGGAIYANNAVMIKNSTFSGNRAKDFGGTFYVSVGNITLQNTIVVGGAGAAACFGSTTNGEGNVSWPDASCPGLILDPKLRPLANNGGDTWTMALQESSAGIHSANAGNCPVVDQRGWPRLLQGQCDSGAFEWVGLLFQPFISK